VTVGKFAQNDVFSVADHLFVYLDGAHIHIEQSRLGGGHFCTDTNDLDSVGEVQLVVVVAGDRLSRPVVCQPECRPLQEDRVPEETVSRLGDGSCRLTNEVERT
jgi:hypothetical protein